MPNDNDVTTTQADHIATFKMLKDRTPDYVGDQPKPRHYQRIHAAYDAAIAALTPPIEAPNLSREVEAEKGWQPIETAPKDGTRVLLWSGRWTGPACGIWVNAWTVGYDLPPFLHQPTHWRPLPEPPARTALSPEGQGK